MVARCPSIPRMLRIAAGITSTATVALCLTAVAAASAVPRPPVSTAAAASCGPASTKPHFRGTVPTPQDVLGYPLGSKEATDQEIGRYWGAVDRSSDRVVTGVYAHSWEG